MKLLYACILVLLTALTSGCGNTPLSDLDSKKESITNLFINLNVSDDGIALGDITHSKGDIDLENLKETSSDVRMKLCNSLTDEVCMDNILNLIDKNIKRHEILAVFRSLIKENKDHKAMLEAMKAQYQESYASAGKDLKLHYLINDESKLYKGEKLPLSELAFVGLNDLSYPISALHLDDIENLFPHPAEDFIDNVLIIKADLHQAYTKDKEVYKRTLKERISNYPIMRRDPLKEGAFTMKVKAVRSIPRGTLDKTRVIFRIVGKDVKNMYPYKFIAKNRDLKVSYTKRKVSFVNQSEDTITLKDITFFYNEASNKTLLGNNFGFSTIDSEMTTTSESSSFLSDALNEAASFTAMSEDKAKSTKVRFAMTLHYTKSGSDKVYTLKGEKNITLWQAITGW